MANEAATQHHPKYQAHKPEQDAVDYELQTYTRGLDFERPPLTFQASKWEELACSRLSADSKGYVYGSAGVRETTDKNRAAFKKWSIVPRRLVKYDGFPDLKTEILGEQLSVPIAMAPVGVLKIFNPDGEMAATRAAAQEAVPYILSTASSTSIEDVAQANGVDGQRWYQLYWPSREHDDITISLLQRANKAGFTTLFVTLDTYILGWRPSDMDNGYNPFMRADRIGVELGMTDPVFRQQFKERHGVDVEEKMNSAAPEWMRTIFPGTSKGWEDVEFLKSHWDGPIVLKGIQSIVDAKKAAEVGVAGIVVSNHGGRQQDGGNSSLGVLPHIVDAVGDKLTIFFDSGIQSGADIAKALALGADCVLVGRPYVYGLALGGEKGVEHVLKSLVGELELTLHLAGIQSVKKEHLNREALVLEDDLFNSVKGIGLH
ncbi:FMN-dependent alpha-hydroxy acid dehydrogenase [Cucurbitaria berberidis CBS 394.84]|uniref:FMN-dependent alpha-hydroxy acid dehydrogenase n=1 Tax=Cucurbitaria berberidis CBS 394.84 TaxID=1168544 RepID=A0A9P4L990_9PLEO|nr:FMN-dependent alpha-hydroxy acid dehydrogenase [Cucurbitaria berberidis CBS 394.84]KAF1845974.1 FMN-dependent alpha-hydroxy acid dehydrogenase [Cucurbitaria berberidis CBS 394.84]